MSEQQIWAPGQRGTPRINKVESLVFVEVRAATRLFKRQEEIVTALSIHLPTPLLQYELTPKLWKPRPKEVLACPEMHIDKDTLHIEWTYESLRAQVERETLLDVERKLLYGDDPLGSWRMFEDDVAAVVNLAAIRTLVAQERAVIV